MTHGSAMHSTPLEVHGLAFAYPNAEGEVFSDIDLEIEEANMVAVLGNNGAGKSTLLDLLSGILRPTRGRVSIEGEPLESLNRREIAQRVAYVAQSQSVPHLSVYDEILLGRRPHISWSISEEDRTIVADVISSLGLTSFAMRYCDELSGGERQKVFIARALAQRPRLLVLDEPTSALDPRNQIDVLTIIRDAARSDSFATVMVLHDVNLALRFCDRFVFMRDGRVVAIGGHEVVTEEVLYRTYGTRFAMGEINGIPVAVPTVNS